MNSSFRSRARVATVSLMRLVMTPLHAAEAGQRNPPPSWARSPLASTIVDDCTPKLMSFESLLRILSKRLPSVRTTRDEPDGAVGENSVNVEENNFDLAGAIFCVFCQGHGLILAERRRETGLRWFPTLGAKNKDAPRMGHLTFVLLWSRLLPELAEQRG